MSSDIAEKIRRAAVLNAIKHEGKAELQAVLGNLISENAALRSQTRDLIPIILNIINEVNATPLEALRDCAAKWPTDLTKERTEEVRRLPPLPNLSS